MVCFYAPRYFHILYHSSFNHAYEEDYRYGSCRFRGEHHGFLLLPGSGRSAPDPLPKFNDLNQPAMDVAPVVMKSKK